MIKRINRDSPVHNHTLTYNELLKLKIELLCKGANLDTIINKGRRAGAGPAGGRYIILPCDFRVNVALWGNFVRKSQLKIQEVNGKFFLHIQNQKNETNLPITVITQPKFYSKRTSDGIPMWKVALLHGTDCLATTISQKCVYVNQGEPCRFCGIELPLKSGKTISIKKPKQFTETVEAAVDEGVCKHITITTGTTASADRGSKLIARVVKEVKDNWNIPIHIQIEPPKENKYLDILAEAGTDTIGIHIESFDQKTLNEVCPGKAKTGLKRYYEAWKYSVELFGQNQVSSFIIAGIGENDESILDGAENLARIGVIPYLVPLRPIIGTPFEDRRPPSPKRMLSLYTQIAEILKKYDCQPSQNKAGCVKCGFCSAIQDSLFLN